MKIYTKTGDKGTTSLIYGQRVSKTDSRVEAYGTCDETNSMIGLAVSLLKNESFEGKDQLLEVFHEIQTKLFHVGAELATPEGKEVKWKIKEKDISFMEAAIDKWDSQLDQLQNFILPGGHPAGASLHAARTIARRAERCAVALGDEADVIILAYLNRLSDLLFVAARYVNMKTNLQEHGLHQPVE
ncbi:cob(I)yrinic acid a,c-diamide adenosyltransferase [Peribacillus saganii]|uniref:Corrinoid adenosyltransferase n=1 Tax=Peribacillus saganii TaxID=2303992 RepID=A0A372LN28_9BACI|nr:cob(I)yrinic acid a,c-diamide adenosyltransferase [Peribacillus saganii]RFU68168.1 cob(I)yrinic acid a,c-diamide adenosyltransferase [Peribacillus saganii]